MNTSLSISIQESKPFLLLNIILQFLYKHVEVLRVECIGELYRKKYYSFTHLIPFKALVFANIYIIFSSCYCLLITLLRIMLSSSSPNKSLGFFPEFIPCCFSTFIIAVEKTSTYIIMLELYSLYT